MRLSYDFDGIADNLDFVTADIPVPNSPKQRQQIQLDPTASTLYFKAIADAGRIGPVVGYIQADFRGTGNAFALQMAYVEWRAFRSDAGSRLSAIWAPLPRRSISRDRTAIRPSIMR